MFIFEQFVLSRKLLFQDEAGATIVFALLRGIDSELLRSNHSNIMQEI